MGRITISETLAFLVLGMLVGSSGPAESSFGIVEKGFRWKKSSIRVCYATLRTAILPLLDETKGTYDRSFSRLLSRIREWDMNELQEAQELVREEFLVSNGLEFTGFERCPDRVTSRDADVILMRITNPNMNPDTGKVSGEAYGLADIGPLPHRPSLIAIEPGRHEVAEIQKMYLRTIVLHELGHTAGLRHDHLNRPGESTDRAAVDPLCQMVLSKSMLRENIMNPVAGFSGVEVTEFDRNSIMSYCLPFFTDENAGNVSELISLNSVVHELNPEFRTGLGSRSLLAHGYYLDPRNSRAVFSQIDGETIRVRYEYLPRLSSADVHALRCLYDVEPSERCRKIPVRSVRGLPAFRPQDHFTIRIGRMPLEVSRKPGETPILLFSEGGMKIVSKTELHSFRLKPHCAVRASSPGPGAESQGDLKLVPYRKVLSEWGKKLGEVDMLARFDKFNCSPDLENGELWISEATFRRIFGDLLNPATPETE